MCSLREQLQYELCEAGRTRESAGIVHVISMPQVNLRTDVSEDRNCGTRLPTYWSPMRLNVSSAIRIDSVEPLMEGEPLHEAPEGISWVLGQSEEAERLYWELSSRLVMMVVLGDVKTRGLGSQNQTRSVVTSECKPRRCDVQRWPTNRRSTSQIGSLRV